MDIETLGHFKGWFSRYVAAYYNDDSRYNETIRLKEEHTERVCKEIVMLGEALNLFIGRSHGPVS